MADNGRLPSPTSKYRKRTSSFLGSPRLFTPFASKAFSETDVVMSPTSILDSKTFLGFKTPFWYETSAIKTPEPESKRHWDKLDSQKVGLGIVDALDDEKSDSKLSKPKTRMVVFGSQLKIQVPPLLPSALSQAESPKSPSDFGIKTRTCQSGSSPQISPFGSASSGLANPTGCLSVTEMELSEDYTCIITHGPNPRTTHIYNNCIIESCCGVVGFSGDRLSYPSHSFLSFCHTCKKNLGQGNDIYIYRGEKAFCSCECRNQGMLLEGEVGKLESEDANGTCSR